MTRNTSEAAKSCLVPEAMKTTFITVNNVFLNNYFESYSFEEKALKPTYNNMTPEHNDSCR